VEKKSFHADLSLITFIRFMWPVELFDSNDSLALRGEKALICRDILVTLDLMNSVFIKV